MDHDQYIREHYETMSDKEIAAVLGRTELSVKNRRQRMGLRKSSQGVRPTSPNEKLSKIAELLEKNNIPVEEIGKVEKVRIGTYQMLTKNDEGEAEVHDLEVASLVMSPTWADGPEWPVVQQADPVKIQPVKTRKVERKFKRAFIFSDIQIGYRRDLRTDKLTPFHDEAAMDVALQLCRKVNPDLVIIIGDFLDLPEHGKYLQEAGFARTTQAALNRGHQYLAQIRAIAPHAEIRFLEGNHSLRLAKHILTNAAASFGLQRANVPEEWPVLSVPFLLRMDELNIEYVAGYPANITWINDNLACIHGHKLKVSQVVDDERVSIIQGHTHRISLQHKTRRVRGGAKENLAATIGCLCRVDGAVPGVHSGFDEWGNPVKGMYDWQQAVAVVHYEEGNGRFALDMVSIHDGSAIYQGEMFEASDE